MLPISTSIIAARRGGFAHQLAIIERIAIVCLVCRVPFQRAHAIAINCSRSRDANELHEACWQASDLSMLERYLLMP